MLDMAKIPGKNEKEKIRHLKNKLSILEKTKKEKAHSDEEMIHNGICLNNDCDNIVNFEDADEDKLGYCDMCDKFSIGRWKHLVPYAHYHIEEPSQAA